MELLLLLVLAPSTIFAQKYGSSSSSANPNDQPFLPIYPVYPYSPKLIKRGTEHGGSGGGGSELVSHLTPELYGAKLEPSSAYTPPSYGANYQRDPYYPSYNPYPKSSAGGGFPAVSSLIPSATFGATGSYPAPYNPSYGAGQTAGAYTARHTYTPYTGSYSNPYSYTNSPYGGYNSYTTPYTPQPNPYTSGSYVPGAYPNYNYQAPYYYPNYYNQPYPPHPPPPPPPPAPASAEDYPGSGDSEDASDEEDDQPSPKPQSKKPQNKKNGQNGTGGTDNDEKDGQFVDGGNFLSSATKDLDGQSTTFKAPNPYNNQLRQLSNLDLRNLAIPGLARTTYRVISVGGQPVGPDYPLPSNYAKVQQLEQIMSQTLAKLLAQNAANQAALRNDNNNRYEIAEQSDDSGTYGTAGPADRSAQNVIAKTGLAYVVDRNNQAQIGQVDFPGNYGNRRNPLIVKVQDPNQLVPRGTTLLTKAKYAADGQAYPQKSVTTVSIQQTPGVYIPPEASKDVVDKEENSPIEYNDYDTNAGGAQNYDGTNAAYKKNEQNYSIDQGGQGAVGSYHNSNLVTVQTPRSQNYQYSSYLPTQPTQQQSRDYKTSLDDVNFGTKRSATV